MARHSDRSELCDLATDLAVTAGELVRAGRPAAFDMVQVKSSPTDVVTAMDRAAEQFIVDELARRRPGDGILAEEGHSGRSNTGVRWIVDPIDGTVNYLYGIPWYAVSVAAEVEGTIVAGAVHNPANGETYRACLGAGAFLGGQRLRCSAPVSLAQSLVSTGFSYASARRVDQAQVAAAVLARVRDLRRLGTAALDLCQVAAGRLDAHYEQGLWPWDYAAGSLIAAEAGATVTGLRGAPAGQDFLLAAAPTIASDLIAVLEGLLA